MSFSCQMCTFSRRYCRFHLCHRQMLNGSDSYLCGGALQCCSSNYQDIDFALVQAHIPPATVPACHNHSWTLHHRIQCGTILCGYISMYTHRLSVESYSERALHSLWNARLNGGNHQCLHWFYHAQHAYAAAMASSAWEKQEMGSFWDLSIGKFVRFLLISGLSDADLLPSACIVSIIRLFFAKRVGSSDPSCMSLNPFNSPYVHELMRQQGTTSVVQLYQQ